LNDTRTVITLTCAAITLYKQRCFPNVKNVVPTNKFGAALRSEVD